MAMKYKTVFVISAWVVGLPMTASAHFRLDYPAATTEQDGIGNNKDLPGVNAENVASPCGGSKLLTNAVTTLRPGSKLLIKWLEPYKRDGHYRISFAKNRADLKSPKVETVGADKIAVSAAIETGGSILMDGVHVHVGKDTPEYKRWEQEVTLPDYICDRCTLQLIHFQNNHPWPYLMYHCADITLSATAPEGVMKVDGGIVGGGVATDAGVRVTAVDAGTMGSTSPDSGTTTPTGPPAGGALDARTVAVDPVTMPGGPSNGTPGPSTSPQPPKAKPTVDPAETTTDPTPSPSNKGSGGCSTGKFESGSAGGLLTILVLTALGMGRKSRRRRV